MNMHGEDEENMSRAFRVKLVQWTVDEIIKMCGKGPGVVLFPVTIWDLVGQANAGKSPFFAPPPPKSRVACVHSPPWPGRSTTTAV